MDKTPKTVRDEKARWAEDLLSNRPPQQHETDWGDPVEVLYTPDDLGDDEFAATIGFPGEYPYVRGIHPSMYLGRTWTMRSRMTSRA